MNIGKHEDAHNDRHYQRRGSDCDFFSLPKGYTANNEKASESAQALQDASAETTETER
jgi:hypothetical protein